MRPSLAGLPPVGTERSHAPSFVFRSRLVVQLEVQAVLEHDSENHVTPMETDPSEHRPTGDIAEDAQPGHNTLLKGMIYHRTCTPIPPPTSERSIGSRT